MFEILYDLVIRPIWLLLEIVFKTAYSICNNAGLSIVFVSLVVNILVLPLYLKSDALQSEERKKQKDMERWIKHIRRNFKGDERFMVLSEYYRQNDYQPWYVLKSSLSLLLQIPFFIAAYTFLSNLQLLHGVSFLFIRDLGLPDSTFLIRGFSINILPIAMTLINLVSSAIYTKAGPFREKVQTVGMALVFLVLLYNSPSGLVLYWTLNNLFSLCKNAVMVFVKNDREIIVKDIPDTISGHIWLASSVFITIIFGVLIPLSVISSAPVEFMKTGSYADPVRFVVSTTSTAAGFFLVWSAVIFFLGTSKFRKVFGLVCASLAMIFFSDYMFFSQNFGILFDDLVFSKTVGYTGYESLLNGLFLVFLTMMIIILVHRRPQWIVSVFSLLSVAGLILGVYQSVQVSSTVRKTNKYKVSTYETSHIEPVIKLSRTNRNVVVFVIDRAIGAYIPYIVQEKPEIAREYSGFTFYPNTVSFAGCTLLAAPAMYGGYEYTTYDINQRKGESIKDKINQSLTVMPTVFSNEGYHSTLCDIPNGNLNEYGDPSIFEDIDDCETHWLTYGAYSSLMTEDEKKATNAEREKRNFFYYSLFRACPLLFQDRIYDNGNYNSVAARSVSNTFANSYVVMKNLPGLTQVLDENKGQLFIMHNMMTHDETLMDPPDYMLKSTAPLKTSGDDVVLDKSGALMHTETVAQLANYETNMSAILFISDWLEELKRGGVYDNTRIIIVADHGYTFWQFDELADRDIDLDAMHVNPLLMVKDFNAKGDMIIDDSLMSNADVPAIAMKDIVEDPVNPFTGNSITNDRKTEGPLVVTQSNMWQVSWHPENEFDISDSKWYSIHDNIYDRSNWSVFEE